MILRANTGGYVNVDNTEIWVDELTYNHVLYAIDECLRVGGHHEHRSRENGFFITDIDGDEFVVCMKTTSATYTEVVYRGDLITMRTCA